MIPNPGFKVTVYIQVEYLKKMVCLGRKLLKNLIRNHNHIYYMTSLTEPELLQGATAHSSKHEGNEVSEGGRGGYPSGPDAILRYPGSEFVGPSDNRARINESELEEGREVGGPVSARTIDTVKGSKPDSRLVSGERSQQSARRSQKQRLTVVDASNAEDATIGAQPCGQPQVRLSEVILVINVKNLSV